MRVFVLIEILRWRRLDRLGAEHDPRHFGSRHQLRRSRIFEESVISVDEEKVNIQMFTLIQREVYLGQRFEPMTSLFYLILPIMPCFLDSLWSIANPVIFRSV